VTCTAYDFFIFLDIFEEVRKGVVNKLSKMTPADFTNYVTIQSNLKGTLRDQIDTTGLFWNW
jgi:hypothetical protein